MPRPQRYTDTDIAAAIQALAAEGEDINPMRVRMRLGGGNVGRIKAVIARTQTEPVLGAKAAAPVPETLARDFERLSTEASQQILSIATRCWAAAWTESAKGLRDEAARQRTQIERLEKDVSASSDLIAQMEEQRDTTERALDAHIKEKASLAETCASLQSALRNTESDLRAAQRIIENFERNQRQDREEIRNLQRRIEGLVGEIAVLKAGSPEPNVQKPRSRNRTATKP
jgi:chromosome segregation ATPase